MSKEIRELKPCLACGGIMRPIMKYHPSYRQSDLELLRENSMIFSKMTKSSGVEYAAMMMYEVKDLVDDLLEIVKEGGVDAKTDS